MGVAGCAAYEFGVRGTCDSNLDLEFDLYMRPCASVRVCVIQGKFGRVYGARSRVPLPMPRTKAHTGPRAATAQGVPIAAQPVAPRGRIP
jgi:hypothetical protein